MLSAIYCDAGTTNTRVWLVEGERVLAKTQASVGARDTARDGGSNQKLKTTLRHLFAEVQEQAHALGESYSTPQFVLGTGMLTSPLGLMEVPYVQAPAGLTELVAGTQLFSFPELLDLPVFLIPGVRTGPVECASVDIGSCDVMRGEESLCLGVHASGWLKEDGVLLNLGSHWKITTWRQKKIVGSMTLLSGEMIYAAQTQTVLTDAVPSSRVSEIDWSWCEAGIKEQRQSGLMRALFCVRLLQLANRSSPLQRMSFLLGAFISDALESWFKSEFRPHPEQNIVISGGGVLAEAWRQALVTRSCSSLALSDQQVEQALLKGLVLLASQS